MANSLVSAAMVMFGMGEDELPEPAVQRESVHAAAEGEHQHGGRAVDGVARAQLA